MTRTSAPPLLQPFTDDGHLNAKPSTFGIIIEPLFVIFLLAAGVIFNRRPLSRACSPISSPSLTPTSRRCHTTLRVPKPRDTSRFANNWISTTLYRYPFILEVFYWGLTSWLYQIGRDISAMLYNDDGNFDISRRHTMQVLDVERYIRIQWENKVQDSIFQHAWAIFALNQIYSFIHIPATIVFLAYFYHTQPFHIYAVVRRTMALANFLAFVVFMAWPCMPPRLLPPSYSFIDTVYKHGAGSFWTTNKFYDPLTAMPSLHFGYSLIIGIALSVQPQQRWRNTSPLYVRVLFLLYPALFLLAIVATANHSFFDALAGLIVVALARYANTMLVSLLVLENALFRLLHIHKPPPSHFVESQDLQDELPHFHEDALKHTSPDLHAGAVCEHMHTGTREFFVGLPTSPLSRLRSHDIETS